MDSLKKFFSKSNKPPAEKVFDNKSKAPGEKTRRTDIELNRLAAETPILQMRYMIDDYDELFGPDTRDF